MKQMNPLEENNHYRDLHPHLINPSAIVNHYIARNKLTVDSNGTIRDTETTPRNILEDRCYLEYLTHHSHYSAVQRIYQLPKVAKFSYADLSIAMQDAVYNLEKEAFKAKVTQLACQQEDLTELVKWCRALNPACTDLDIAKMAQFIWQAKRKMNQLKVTYHLFVLVYGAQEVGKSTAIEKLIEPFSPNSRYLKLDQLVDDKLTPALAKSYVVFLDELDWKSREDTSRLKNIITSTTLTYRPMRSNTAVELPNNATVIAAANKHLDEIITDNTGMRRYAEFCTADKLDHAAINNIDYLALIKGVDENKQEGYTTKFKDDLKEEQKILTTKEDIEFFLDDYVMQPPTETAHFIALSKVYDAYKTHCEENGFRCLDIKWFSKKLKHRGLKVERVWLTGKNTTVIYVSDACLLLDNVRTFEHKLAKGLA